MTNWFTSTHPDAPYHSNMIAAHPGPNRTRITMFNARAIVRYPDGRAERRTLDGNDEYRRVVREEFGLNVSQEDLAAMLKVVEQRGTKGAPHPFFS
nr:arylamine N-acetyltransferase [Bradyrhizobium sp. CCBAU 53380]